MSEFVIVDSRPEDARDIIAVQKAAFAFQAALMIAVEARFPRAARFELFTGCKSDGNIRLYERIGYRIYRREETLVYMEKPGPSAAR